MNLINFIPNRIGNKNIKIKELPNKLIISAKGTGSPKQVILNKKIKISPFIFEIIGLYFGDGLNTRNHSAYCRTAFANSNYKLHEYWLKFLESFGINKNQLFAQISIGKNIDEKSVLNYWLIKTSIPRERFAKVSKCKDKSCKEGVLSIEFNSVIFRSIFNNIFEYCINFLSENKDYVPYFIAGLFAAEGRVTLRNNSLNYLGIAVKNNEKRTFIKNLLGKVGIKTSKDNRLQEIIIHNYINFRIFNDLNMATIHPNKCRLFKGGFENLSTSQVPALLKLKIIKTLKETSMTRFQISKKLNKGISPIHKNLRDLEIKGVVKRIEKDKLKDVWELVKNPQDYFSLMNLDYCSKKKN